MAKILLIEDEEMVRYSLRCALESEGHEVLEATDGEDGVSQFRELADDPNPADIVVTDILMPKKHGYDTISEILDISPETKIIAISGGGGGEFDTKAFSEMSKFLGAERMLAKPFSSEEFLLAVNNCLT
ncbi:MAG: response regulator [Alphaproteobacteria bacterium]|jgi:CheY-like chemotaxis protein|nr:response regulator [Alphaproteobacteria bacterium]MBT7944351.1 response regulator [Alphaproteobacteria bacterium]